MRSLTRLAKALWVAAIVYFFSPIDFIPDSIPLVGWFDDFVVVGLAVWASLDPDFSETSQLLAKYGRAVQNTQKLVLLFTLLALCVFLLILLLTVHYSKSPERGTPPESSLQEEL